MEVAVNQSGRPGSNRRPEPWQGSALPTALRPRIAGQNLSHECARAKASRQRLSCPHERRG